jgi:CRP-like cAMP-binding protein
MQNLIQTISEKTFISEQVKKQIEHCFEEIHTKKGDVILQQNNYAQYLYFVEQGILHNYYYHDGKQVSSWFYSEYSFVTAWNSFYTKKASFEEIECLEDCVLYRISYSNFQKLITEHPQFGNFARLLAESMLSFIDEFSKGWAFLPAKKKYEITLDLFPDIEQRVKLGLIASFLGISQETLSRIRS